MQYINELIYGLFDRVLHLPGSFGLPLGVLAWAVVFMGSLGMGVVLWKQPLHGKLKGPLVIGILSLAAHLADYFVTLWVSPDLSLEANPLWRHIIHAYGLTAAKWYGLTGKILLAILSVEFYAYYLLHRRRLFPDAAADMTAFFRTFGARNAGRGVHVEGMVNYFSFMFALLGPFYFYIALLNALVDTSIYLYLPAAPLALLFYLMFLSWFYFVLNYREFRRSN